MTYPHTHQYLIDALEQALPTIRDAEKIINFLSKIDDGNFKVASMKRRIHKLNKGLLCYIKTTVNTPDKEALANAN